MCAGVSEAGKGCLGDLHSAVLEGRTLVLETPEGATVCSASAHVSEL